MNRRTALIGLLTLPIVSTTVRAAAPLQVVAAQAHYASLARELAPGASVAVALAAANWPDAREPVLIVGHQPTLGMLASMLLSGDETYWSVRKGAVWWLSNRAREGGAAAVLKVVIGPDYV